ncbi:helix-turn-helix domain-containing protein [Streptomyces sp. NPDC058740]|uniref:helix-turn-helix domain-containing protein n=1 Tax=Streptomyces sp. NPDC058740 TaxID=3346619 RepID=UPI00367A5033
MTPIAHDTTPCTNPNCSNTVQQKPKGRRRLYCSEECGRWFRRYGRPRLADVSNDQYVTQLAQAAQQGLAQVTTLAEKTDEPIAALLLLLRLLADLEHLRDGLVQQSYDRKIKPSALADALNYSPDTISRWKDAHTRRRERRGDQPGTEPSGTAPSLRIPAPRHPAPGPPRRPPVDAAPGTPSPPSTTPASALAMALSTLQRQKRPSYSTLGAAAGVSRSYVSRIFSGERIPSWPVARTITVECGGDPEVIRPLWEAARGYRLAQPSSLHAALQGMQLAAGNIPSEELSARTGLAEQRVAGLLHGTQTADWPTVSTLVTALQGQPETIRPLWQVAQGAHTQTGIGGHTSSISAGSFG